VRKGFDSTFLRGAEIMDIKNATVTSGSAPGKIDRPKAGKIGDSSPLSGNRKISGANQQSEGYNVAVSSEAQELTAAHAKAFDIAKNTSPIRADKVASLKAQIQAGTYNVDSGNIADGILREAIREKLATSE
jgi:negative regulator of flagellin synthesis FlgM